ncbi:plasmodesmata-located protein 7-like [Andrographis paniculata]|uniref:plasmodesmata-located protein 7-like n=1 Tax=Andrographis paniculata TaxID=175694 RepID=UPI0021E73C56|nr:plasmodesmata-located protein 7-like [Andrographis paniculata]
MTTNPLFYLQLLLFLINLRPSSSSPESFVYVGCSQLKYSSGSPYESNLNSILASFVNSASIAAFNSFKISSPGSTAAVYGLYQCRGDLAAADCHRCVASAVSRIGAFCAGTSGGALQLDGCFIKYDNESFVGTVDKAVVSEKCGAATAAGYGGSDDVLTRRDAVLAYLKDGGGQYFRVGGSGKVQGMVQCVQDLSLGECQECLSEAVQRLKSDCAAAPSGDMFLGKCYARYSDHGYSSEGGGRRRGWPGKIAVVAGLGWLIWVLRQ